LEFSQLRYFVACSERESFTRAAGDLQITQPALSRAVAKLEEELGQPVFERMARRLTLTDAGRVLLGKAKQILALVEEAKAELVDDGETGRVRVGAIPTVAPYLLPPVLQTFAAQRPKASAVVLEEVTERLLHRLAHGEIDVGLLAAPVEARYLEVKPLFSEELLLVLPTSHPLATKPRATVADVRNEPFVLLDEAHCLSGNIESFCRQKSFHPIAVERTSQLAMVQELVALGHGVSLIPEMARKVDRGDRRVYRSLSGAKPMRTVVMAWNPYRFQSKLAKRFRETLTEAAKSRT
jgi:LysR family hydrogen peroxide-inducible transcriptional activator